MVEHTPSLQRAVRQFLDVAQISEDLEEFFCADYEPAHAVIYTYSNGQNLQLFKPQPLTLAFAKAEESSPTKPALLEGHYTVTFEEFGWAWGDNDDEGIRFRAAYDFAERCYRIQVRHEAGEVIAFATDNVDLPGRYEKANLVEHYVTHLKLLPANKIPWEFLTAQSPGIIRLYGRDVDLFDLPLSWMREWFDPSHLESYGDAGPGSLAEPIFKKLRLIP